MTPAFFFGVLFLSVLLILMAFIYDLAMRKTVFFRHPRDVAIVLLNVFFIIIVADFIVRSPQPSYAIPMASVGMIITLLVGFDMAFLAVVLSSIFIATIIGGRIEVMLTLVFGSTVGMYMIKDVRRRAGILWAGFLAGAANFFAIFCTGLINGMDMDFYVKDGSWGLTSGIVSGFIVLGVLPLFEHMFKIPTNISLLELSDLNHPLLKKMALEATGTYHHSIMVGNLAESACDSIGANSLLARVGAYYHDIGKIPMAEYFSENEMGVESKHESLTPSMSALIIAKHVKEGEEMAIKYKLNKTMVDFITQHHGNSLIYYFYQKAVQNAGDDTALKEEDFRYPGPKPQTKESAIIMLADSVEASSRALTEPTPASIRNLVKKIINNKFIDGQLDECDLTLKDIDKIADSFVRVLIGVFHARLAYPEEAKKISNGIVTGNDKNKHQKPQQKKKL
ncbi:MAG: HDIG domain-containing protein, partial [Candidatus Omnitrophica bacterium]|nr:HDIG domain-containing protein [Candidatus Omnitrophota bacterium]